ncbi:MAG: hypothetical protein DIJKHBIC_04501 [Thermoanaerobaculia bacterium]|nr:hypothetical protein [Thermoanaerobaculia bacterium]
MAPEGPHPALRATLSRQCGRGFPGDGRGLPTGGDGLPFSRTRGRRGRGMRAHPGLSSDRLQHGGKIGFDFLVPKTKDLHASCPEDRIPFGITGLLVLLAVNTAVHFNTEPLLGTEEIQDEHIEGVLPPELHPSELSVPQARPQDLLSVGL